MPRVKALGHKDPRETAVLELLGGTMSALHINRKELARLSGISESTLNRRLANVGTMQLCELWAVEDVRKRNGLEVKTGGK